MDKERNNGNTVLLTVIGVATLLVALVGATFAYFSATITSDSKESVFLTTAQPAGITYTGSALTLGSEEQGAVPGDHNEGSFTVKNNDTNFDQTYDMVLVIEENGFTTTTTENAHETEGAIKDDGNGQLKLTITHTNTEPTELSNSGEYDLTDGEDDLYKTGSSIILLNDQKISKNTTQTYQISLKFENKDYKQDNNQGTTFKAHIELSDPKTLATE